MKNIAMMADFNSYDLMVITDSGLLFWAAL